VFNIGGAELLVILLVALLVLGPDKLPQAARQVGHFVGEFQRVAGGFRQEIQSALAVEDDKSGQAGKTDNAGRRSTPRDVPPKPKPKPKPTSAPDTAEPADEVLDEPETAVVAEQVSP